MKTFVTVTALAVLVAAGAGWQSVIADETQNQREAVLKLERDWMEAVKNRDKKTLDRILAEGFVLTDEEGRRFTKAQYIADVDRSRVESYSLSELDVRIVGNTSIVSGRWSGKMTVDGKDASADVRFTDTFVASGNSWKALASQDTRIAVKK